MLKSHIYAATLATVVASGAQAGIIQIGGTNGGPNGMVSARPGVCTVDFNGGNATNTCGATYTENGTTPDAAHFVSGSVANQYAAPAGDTSPYFAVSPISGTPVTITLSTPANYFGFFTGSLDSYNLVQFYLNGALVDSFTGTDINAVAFPGQPTNGNRNQANFIDYFPGSFYDTIVYSSSGIAFETDNHAFGVVTVSIPEPGSVALLAMGALGLAAFRRRKS